MLESRVLEVDLRLTLVEQQLSNIALRLQSLQDAPLTSESAPTSYPDTRQIERLEDLREQLTAIVHSATRDFSGKYTERLLAAGFTAERIAWIERRTDELKLAVIRAEHEAELEGREATRAETLTPAIVLRSEMGDVEYERYLRAIGAPTTVPVHGVLAGSSAATAGLLNGDEIVAYDGSRVFNLPELQLLTLSGIQGETVIVEVIRNGSRFQLALPRGPLGISTNPVVDFIR